MVRMSKSIQLDRIMHVRSSIETRFAIYLRSKDLFFCSTIFTYAGIIDAEARKSPALDGKVERDSQGKEIRYPVILNNAEKLISRKVCVAFKQTVCGFDLLR